MFLLDPIKEEDEMYQVQIPLRISRELSERFTRVSNNTRIPKSELGRLAISSFLRDVEVFGMGKVLTDYEAKL